MIKLSSQIPGHIKQRKELKRQKRNFLSNFQIFIGKNIKISLNKKKNMISNNTETIFQERRGE